MGGDTDHVTFETIAGTLSADIIGDNVRIAMSDPFDLDLNADIEIDGMNAAVHTINTGVPHTVVFTDDLKNFDVLGHGATIRYHDHFAPNGTNANFASILDDQHIAIRTYERGVEGETLACGTGMTACALIHHLLNDTPSPISVDVEGGETLEIGFVPSSNNSFTNVTLTGPADFVFQGEITI
jgi:diaminopimelate epimerase